MEHRAVAERIHRSGSIRFDEFMELALYAPGEGFFATGGGAGRGGADFLTSPEVGPLFGTVIGEYLDRRWESLGCPDPFVVVEAAAGRGALAMAVLGASPRCRAALRYVLVERSEALRARQAEHLPLGHPFEVLGPTNDPEDPTAQVRGGLGPLLCSLVDLPAASFDGVVLANELLDNVPFRLAERGVEGWQEVHVTLDGRALVELLVPLDAATAARLDDLAPAAVVGARVPVQAAARDWVQRACSILRRGSLVVIDYTSSTAQLARRPQWDWLRTYRSHERGGGPLLAPGSQDITAEVAVDQLASVRPPTRRSTQADWLVEHGIGDMVEEGRRVWTAAAARPDLAAMRARSRVAESEALLDPDGLGAFEVLEWEV